MKLFVWNDPFPVRYGGSILFVMAATEDDARREALSAHHARHFISTSDPKISLDDIGPPDAVFDQPKAIAYEWQE